MSGRQAASAKEIAEFPGFGPGLRVIRTTEIPRTLNGLHLIAGKEQTIEAGIVTAAHGHWISRFRRNVSTRTQSAPARLLWV